MGKIKLTLHLYDETRLICIKCGKNSSFIEATEGHEATRSATIYNNLHRLSKNKYPEFQSCVTNAEKEDIDVISQIYG
jgi:hypothetical protein